MDIDTTQASKPIRLLLKRLNGSDFRHTATPLSMEARQEIEELSQRLNSAFSNSAIPTEVELKATLVKITRLPKLCDRQNKE